MQQIPQTMGARFANPPRTCSCALTVLATSRAGPSSCFSSRALPRHQLWRECRACLWCVELMVSQRWTSAALSCSA